LISKDSTHVFRVAESNRRVLNNATYHTHVFQGVKSNRTMYCSAKLGPLSNIINKYLVPTESHFYFRFTGAIFSFTAIIIYQCQAYVLWIGRSEMYV